MINIDLNGKCAIVTGASQGIGMGCAQWLSRAGASVLLTARNEENLNLNVSEINRSGGNSIAVPVDLTEENACKLVVDKCIEEFGGIDFLVNVAGVSRRTDPLDTTDEEIDIAFDLKLRSAIRLARLVVPSMKKRGGGSIIFTSGLSQLHSASLQGSGCIPNAGIAAYKHLLAKRLAPDNIRVNLINPGSTKTPRMDMQNKRISDYTGKSVEEVEKDRLSRIPIGRFITPDDCAKTVLFLCSELSTCITGESIIIDGGGCTVTRY